MTSQNSFYRPLDIVLLWVNFRNSFFHTFWKTFKSLEMNTGIGKIAFMKTKLYRERTVGMIKDPDSNFAVLCTFVMVLIMLGVFSKSFSIQKNSVSHEWICRTSEVEEPEIEQVMVLLYLSITWKPLRNENSGSYPRTYWIRNSEEDRQRLCFGCPRWSPWVSIIHHPLFYLRNISIVR